MRGMTIEEIKKAILALPDQEVDPLFEWLQNHYNGIIWDREMEADIERLGLERWIEALTKDSDHGTDEIKESL